VAALGLGEEWIGKGNRESQTLSVMHLRESATVMGLLRKRNGLLGWLTQVGPVIDDRPGYVLCFAGEGKVLSVRPDGGHLCHPGTTSGVFPGPKASHAGACLPKATAARIRVSSARSWSQGNSA